MPHLSANGATHAGSALALQPSDTPRPAWRRVLPWVALGAGAYFNWGWLVAAGIAPLLLTALPCVAMCALGLCMKGSSKSPADAATPHGDSAGDAGQSPTLRLAATDEKADPAGNAGAAEETKVTSSNRKGCC